MRAGPDLQSARRRAGGPGPERRRDHRRRLCHRPDPVFAASRARIIGLFTGTYGLASIVGPLLGGIITDAVGWRGVFYVNLPLGGLALLLVWRNLRAQPASAQRPQLDYLGGAALVAGVSPLLLALSLGGHELAWTSPLLLGLVVLGGILLGVFVRVELRAADPVIPLGLLGSRSVGIATLGLVFVSAALFATSLFTPLFVQGVMGSSATQSGGVLAPMRLAFVLASIIAGQILARFPRYRLVGLAGLLLAASGQLLMAGMGPQTTYPVVARNLVVIGFGLGSALAALRRGRSERGADRADGRGDGAGHVRARDRRHAGLGGLRQLARRARPRCRRPYPADAGRCAARHVSRQCGRPAHRRSPGHAAAGADGAVGGTGTVNRQSPGRRRAGPGGAAKERGAWATRV